MFNKLLQKVLSQYQKVESKEKPIKLLKFTLIKFLNNFEYNTQRRRNHFSFYEANRGVQYEIPPIGIFIGQHQFYSLCKLEEFIMTDDNPHALLVACKNGIYEL